MFGLVIYLYIITLELILMFSQIRTKDSNDQQKKRVLRILSLLLLSLFTLLDVYQWGFRYYPLIFVYLVIVLFNEISFHKSKPKQLAFEKHHPIKRTLSIIILFSLSLLPALLFPKYKPIGTTGSYAVSLMTQTYTDSNRIETFTNNLQNRQVNVRIWYPSNYEDKSRLIIYSHGGISLDTSNESLFQELASHGYIVFSVGHPYHSIVTKNDLGKNIWINSTYMNELNRENAIENPEQSFELYQKWMKLRTDDINFVIDTIKALASSQINHALYSQIDIDHIGVIGHSLGGSAALCIGRTRDDVQAVIALESPFMCDITGVDSSGFIFDETPYPSPILSIYSDSAYDNLSLWPQYKNNHLLLSSTDETVHNYHLSGAGHFSLTDLCLTSPILTRLLNGSSSSNPKEDTLKEINSLSLSFLNRYLT